VGVLPTRLSAVDEAATMDILCVDKTGTLTQNQLSVTIVHALAGFDDVEESRSVDPPLTTVRPPF